ncbi:hypothetical protein KA005_09990 [bacterium]|nr:hypothetical protein [bacterium]
MKRKEYELEQEEIRKDYYKKLEAKKNYEPWVKDIPVDMVPSWAALDKCLSCGNPNMKDAISGFECKLCGIKRLSEKEYEYRQNRKQSSLTFYEMARKKKVSNTKREETVLALSFKTI